MTNSMIIIALCSTLGVVDGIRPLTNGEWEQVSDCLTVHNMQPADLENINSKDCLDLFGPVLAGEERLQRLLGRSGSLAFAITEYEKYGIHILTRADAGYPQKFKDKFGKSCPPLFYCVGNLNLLNENCCGFVGSRSITAKDENVAKKMVCRTIDSGNTVVSGGAKGIDSVASLMALDYGGQVIEFLADSMLKRLRNGELYKKIEDDCLLMMSYVHPKASFSVGSAMGRNKFIYAQSEGTVIVKSDYDKGGTWNGAIENLHHGWCSTLCWDNTDYRGNQELIKRGAVPISEQWQGDLTQSKSMVCEEPKSEQLALF